MNNLKPIQIVFFASFVTALFSTLTLFCFGYFTGNVEWKIIVIAGSAVGVFSFIVFYLAIERFLYKRIKLIYRAIRKGKITEDTDFTIGMRENIIKKISDETVQYLEEHEEELFRLKEQEVFRREFLGNLAHELKTPTFSIQGYISTLLDGGLEDANINRSFLEKAAKTVERMSNILEDLDEITKMEVGQIELNMKKFNIVALAKEVFESLEALVVEKKIRLQLHENYPAIAVLADKSKIAQVFTNLIRNAIVYGNDNGIIEIRFHDMEDLIMVEVADNGPGIDKKELPRLFERFYRVEKSRTRNEGGSGLGLAIVKHIIEAHDHNIRVRSTIGVGSTFSFTLDKP
jgi:two-component system phosphate regulon sensor histidine kinase PhoR